MAQKIDGLAWIFENLRRWSRTNIVKGAIEDENIADAVNEAIQQIDDMVIESAVPWATRNATIADVSNNLGTEVEFKTRRLFIEQDLGITDLARVRRIWRLDPGNATVSKPIPYIDRIGPENVDSVRVTTAFNEERWTEDGDIDASGNADMAIMIYNWGQGLNIGSLRVNYWFTPPLVAVDDFYATDANGDRTKRPTLPRKMWPHILTYAKLVILETTGDDYRSTAIWRRYSGPAGVLERVKTVLQAFQVGEPVFVDDTLMDGEPIS